MAEGDGPEQRHVPAHERLPCLVIATGGGTHESGHLLVGCGLPGRADRACVVQGPSWGGWDVVLRGDVRSGARWHAAHDNRPACSAARGEVTASVLASTPPTSSTDHGTSGSSACQAYRSQPSSKGRHSRSTEPGGNTRSSQVNRSPGSGAEAVERSFLTILAGARRPTLRHTTPSSSPMRPAVDSGGAANQLTPSATAARWSGPPASLSSISAIGARACWFAL